MRKLPKSRQKKHPEQCWDNTGSERGLFTSFRLEVLSLTGNEVDHPGRSCLNGEEKINLNLTAANKYKKEHQRVSNYFKVISK